MVREHLEDAGPGCSDGVLLALAHYEAALREQPGQQEGEVPAASPELKARVLRAEDLPDIVDDARQLLPLAMRSPFLVELCLLASRIQAWRNRCPVYLLCQILVINLR